MKQSMARNKLALRECMSDEELVKADGMANKLKNHDCWIMERSPHSACCTCSELVSPCTAQNCE